MNIEMIKNKVHEISLAAPSIRNDDTMYEMMATLADFGEYLETCDEEFDDSEYQEITDNIDHIKIGFEETLDDLYVYDDNYDD